VTPGGQSHLVFRIIRVAAAARPGDDGQVTGGIVGVTGKESNSLEDVEAGMIHSAQNVYTEYPDPRRDEWQTKIVLALKRVPLHQLVKMSGLSRSTLIEIRAGRSRPQRKNRELLAAIVRRLGLI
jgi:hypothetical protein